MPLGVLAAWKAGTWIDRAVMAFAVLGFSVPVFVLGYMLIYVFAICSSTGCRCRAIAAHARASGRSCAT